MAFILKDRVIYNNRTCTDREWKAIGCSGPLPVELDGGPGTANWSLEWAVSPWWTHDRFPLWILTTFENRHWKLGGHRRLCQRPLARTLNVVTSLVTQPWQMWSLFLIPNGNVSTCPPRKTFPGNRTLTRTTYFENSGPYSTVDLSMIHGTALLSTSISNLLRKFSFDGLQSVFQPRWSLSGCTLVTRVSHLGCDKPGTFFPIKDCEEVYIVSQPAISTIYHCEFGKKFNGVYVASTTHYSIIRENWCFPEVAK
jgi:hypothetical protein